VKSELVSVLSVTMLTVEIIHFLLLNTHHFWQFKITTLPHTSKQMKQMQQVHYQSSAVGYIAIWMTPTVATWVQLL